MKMEEEKKFYKNVFMIRKGGENGEKCFITLGNMLMSNKLHDTEEEAIKELENINLESIAKMLVAVINVCSDMVKEVLNNKEK